MSPFRVKPTPNVNDPLLPDALFGLDSDPLRPLFGVPVPLFEDKLSSEFLRGLADSPEKDCDVFIAGMPRLLEESLDERCLVLHPQTNWFVQDLQHIEVSRSNNSYLGMGLGSNLGGPALCSKSNIN